jgi:magnesium-transporting ATPase (P-type)
LESSRCPGLRRRKTTARVKRDGQIKEVAAEDLVSGDILMLDSGDAVPADLRLFEALELMAERGRPYG